MKITCLSLTQPWADLVVDGHKSQETRSWDTKYRGKLYIHAAKGFPKHAKELCWEWPFNLYIKSTRNLVLGAIIGSVELTDVNTSERAILLMQLSESEGTQEEYRFGDYSPGRFVWYLSGPRRFVIPIVAKGSLGLWRYDIDEELLRAYEK